MAKAMQVLDDPDREFVSSPFLKLEILPKAVYGKRQAEVEFYQTFFAAVRHWAKTLTRRGGIGSGLNIDLLKVSRSSILRCSLSLAVYSKEVRQ